MVVVSEFYGKNKLREYILKIYPVDEETLSVFTKDFDHFYFAKNTFLLQENKLNKQTFFLETGYVRSFIHDQEGDEVTTNIYSAPCFVNDFLPFFKQQPAKQNFQAVTPCNGWTMTYENVEKHFRNIPGFREFGRLLVLHAYDALNDRMLEMIKDTAETRYIRLLTMHPGIFQHVPLKIIASYLGITDTSLSRIRKELSQKHFLPNDK